MREIKMRGWNNDLKRYFYAPSESWSIVFHSESIMAQMWSSDGLIDEIPVDCVEMFTGLKDKNGNDIYDGDIVAGFESDLTGKVCYSNDDGAFIFTTTNLSGGMATQLYMDNFGILGNIHEHPHLLQKEQN